MEELGIDFESLFETEFTSQNLLNNSDDITNNLLNLKKRIILTDEVLGKFSETLTENEKLKGEKVKYLEEFRCCRETLLSHLTNHEDCHGKYSRLESKLLTTQQELDLQINLVAARDSVTRQYVSLVKEKDEELKKLKDENQSLKSNANDKTEEKKYKRKYNLALKRSNKLSEIIEKLRISQCSSCQELKSIKTVKKKGKNENDIDDLGSYSPESCVPGSVCSIDTGFESNLSDTDSDLEEVSQKKIHKRAGLEKIEPVIPLKNETGHVRQNAANEKLCEVPSSFTFNSGSTEVHVLVCGDNVISKTNGKVSEYESSSPTLCSHCSKGKKNTAEKYVQTRVVKYVDSCVEALCDVTSKSIQTIEEEQVSCKLSCEFQSKGVQTIPQVPEPLPRCMETCSNKSLSSSVNHVSKCDIDCQTDLEDKKLLQSEVATQTSVEVSSEITHSDVLPNANWTLSPIGSEEDTDDIEGTEAEEDTEDIDDTDEQNNLFNCVDNIQSFSPVPFLLSPFPPSPAIEDSVSEMDDEIMSDISLPPNEEREFFDEQLSHLSRGKSLSLTDSTTQTDDPYCTCHQPANVSRLHVAVQCGSSETVFFSDNIKNQKNTVSANKYAMKHRKGMIDITRTVCAEVNNTGQDRETFWKNIALCLISNGKLETSQKEGLIDLLQSRNDFLHNGTSFGLEADVLSFLQESETSKMQSEDYQQISRYSKRNKLESSFGCNAPVKPIVVEMSSKVDPIQKRVFQFYEDSDDHVSENDCDLVVPKKSMRNINDEGKLVKSKLKDTKKIVNPVIVTLSKLPIHRKRNRSRHSLKRKPTSSEHLQVSSTSSGTFTVSSVAECDNSRILNDKHASRMLPDTNCEVNHDIQGGKPVSWDGLRVDTDNVRTKEPSGTFKISNDVANVSPDSTYGQCNTNMLNSQHETQNFSSHFRREIHPACNANNILSVDTKKNLHKEPCNKTSVRADPNSQLSNLAYNNNICVASQQIPVQNFEDFDGISKNSNECATIPNDQLSTVQQCENLSLGHGSSEYWNSPASSQSSSKTSFHSCDILTMPHVANVNVSVKDNSAIPVARDLQSHCNDGDHIPAKTRRTVLPTYDNQSFESNTNSSNINASKSQTVVTSNVNENNSTSLGKSVHVQENLCKDVNFTVQGDQTHIGPPALTTQACFSENIKSNEKDSYLLQRLNKNQNCDDSHIENLNVINQVCTKEVPEEDKNIDDNSCKEISDSHKETMEDTETSLLPWSPDTPPIQEQTIDAYSILASDLASDDDSSGDDIPSNINNGYSKMESHNILSNVTSSQVSPGKNSSEKVSGNNCGGIVTNSSQSSTVHQDLHEGNIYMKMTNFDNAWENNGKKLNDNNKATAELEMQIDGIPVHTKQFSLNLEARGISKQIIPGRKFLESDVKKDCKPQNDSSGKSFSQEVHKITTNETLTYRKYCESTINKLVPVKPPPVENEIARKTLIRNTVRNKGLLNPIRKELGPEKKCVVPSQTLSEESSLQKQSSLKDSAESSPFHRQGMMGRRKIVVTSPPILHCSASLFGDRKHVESSESKSYSESTKKQQRIAHVPKPIVLCNKRNIGESSCDEMPISQENLKNQPHKAVLRPPLKKTKLQRLKQQCVTQRKRIQNLTLENSVLEQARVKNPVQVKLIEEVNTCVSNDLPTLKDIALDMVLSDSDESIPEKSENIEKNEQCQNKCVKNFKKFKCSSGKEEQNLEENNSNKLEQHGSDTVGDFKSLELLDAKSFVVNDDTKGKLQDLCANSSIDSAENTRNVCGNTSAQIQSEAKEITLWDAFNEQKSRNKANVYSSMRNCKDTSELNNNCSIMKVYNFHSANSCASKDPVEMVKEKHEDNRNKMDELDIYTLESPLSPPNLSRCEVEDFHLPVTIPTSPVHEESSENLDSEIDSRNTTMDINEELESDVEVEDNLLHKIINTENPENNIKSKLRSWKGDSNPRLKKSQDHNILQEYLKHHYEGKRKKKKQAPGKKKNIESLFDTYLSSDFTEGDLTKMVEDCKNVIEGDYRIIVKNVVKYCKHSSREDCDFSNNFPMNPTQQRLFTLVMKLEPDHPTIVDEVLERIGNVVCNFNHHRFLPTLHCLARFFTAFCKFCNYKHRAQIFCYDALFNLKVRAHTVLFAVLTAFPECFPNANTPAGDSPIVKAMVCSVFTDGDATYPATKNLRTYLSNFYCYKRENLHQDDVMKHFMGEIKHGRVPEVEQAVLLMAKFKCDWEWTYEKLMKGCLLQTVENWKKGCTSEAAAALCLKLCAYLAKTPPYKKMYAPPLMDVFENLLFSDTSPSVIKEACILSLAILVQMDDKKVYDILKACRCEEHLKNSKYLKDVLHLVVKRRTTKWWSNFLQT